MTKLVFQIIKDFLFRKMKSEKIIKTFTFHHDGSDLSPKIDAPLAAAVLNHGQEDSQPTPHSPDIGR